MNAKCDRYILGLCLRLKDGPACFKHEPTQILIKTFRAANGDGVCRPPPRSPKHCKSFTNEQLCSLHNMTVWAETKKSIYFQNVPGEWDVIFVIPVNHLERDYFPICVIYISRKESRKINETLFTFCGNLKSYLNLLIHDFWP